MALSVPKIFHLTEPCENVGGDGSRKCKNGKHQHDVDATVMRF